MELYTNAHQIQSLFRGRNLLQYPFIGENILLVDTGIAEAPENASFPCMGRVELRPQLLSPAVVRHAHLDDERGSDAIKRASPGTWLSSGAAERAMIEDPRTLFDLRYSILRADHDVGFDAHPSPQAAKRRKMGLCFSGAERIRLRDDWHLEVLHVPGHFHGQLALYDPKHQAAFVGQGYRRHPGCAGAGGLSSVAEASAARSASGGRGRRSERAVIERRKCTRQNHLPGPHALWEYALVACAAVVLVWVLYEAFRYTFWLREEEPDHIKRKILEADNTPHGRKETG